MSGARVAAAVTSVRAGSDRTPVLNTLEAGAQVSGRGGDVQFGDAQYGALCGYKGSAVRRLTLNFSVAAVAPFTGYGPAAAGA